MQSFISVFWKTIVAILILAAIASLTLDPANAAGGLSQSLQDHARALALHEYDSAHPL